MQRTASTSSVEAECVAIAKATTGLFGFARFLLKSRAGAVRRLRQQERHTDCCESYIAQSYEIHGRQAVLRSAAFSRQARQDGVCDHQAAKSYGLSNAAIVTTAFQGWDFKYDNGLLNPLTMGWDVLYELGRMFIRGTLECF